MTAPAGGDGPVNVPGGPDVVAIGGGHGLASTLRAVRRYAGRVTAVVSVADDGGSSGRLRRSAGIPAPGDLRRCLSALADPGSVWAQALEYRFAGGDVDGHALGNLMIAGLAAVTGDFGSALAEAGALVGAVGTVLPATVGPVDLRGWSGRRQVIGQVALGSGGPVREVGLDPPDVAAPPAVISAVSRADQVVIGPGSLYTSVLAACVVPGIRAALAARTGGRVFVCNLSDEDPETAGASPADHVAALAAHGVVVDAVVIDPRWPEAGRGRSGTGPVEVCRAVAAPGSDVHDPALLGAVLAHLDAGVARDPVHRLT